jgi:hypothetical protein
MTSARQPLPLDMRRADAGHFAANSKPDLVTLNAATYLTLRGRTTFREADDFTSLLDCRRALYAVATRVQSDVRKSGRDFHLPPLEVLWWPFRSFGDGARNAWASTQERWSWKVMLLMPDFVTSEMVTMAAEACAVDANDNRIKGAKLEALDEGLCVQVLHRGPYASLWQSISGLRELVRSSHMHCSGLHHEIYLRCEPHTADQDVRVLIRQPVRRDC